MLFHRPTPPDKAVGRQPETQPLVCFGKPTSFKPADRIIRVSQKRVRSVGRVNLLQTLRVLALSAGKASASPNPSTLNQIPSGRMIQYDCKPL
jgi:hypothetical protein